MKLSVFSPIFYNMTLEQAFQYLKSKGVDSLELGCGGFSGTRHIDTREIIKSQSEIQKLKDLLDKYEISISALSIHSNGVHPDKAVAELATQEFNAACKLSEKLGIDRVVTFSGCPGDGSSKTPNWVTCVWPNVFSELLEYQWNDCLIPYWTERAKTAKDYGVKVAFEMHPGFCVYNPETLMRLRNAVDDTLGANLDPSHLFWQGIDIVAAIKYLGKAIYFFHAKDTAIDRQNTAINGVLDTKPYSDEAARSWIFRTVGYGNSEQTWKEIISALKLVGYDHTISIEHEDSLMTPLEGLGKAIDFLKQIMITQKSDEELWWV